MVRVRYASQSQDLIFYKIQFTGAAIMDPKSYLQYLLLKREDLGSKLQNQ